MVARALTDDELLVSDEPEHFGLFYRRHARAVLGYLMRATRDPEVAADLTAETFAAALVARSRFRPGPTPAAAWLFGIAGHKLADWRRRGFAEQRACRRLGMERVEVFADDLVEIARIGDDVAGTLVAELPDDQRLAVTARVVQERDYAAIADQLGTTEQAARKRVSRGLAALRARLAGREG